jgi:hypothetical protein
MYIGNQPLFQNFRREYFNGGAASYALAVTPGSEDAVLVTVDGVAQSPGALKDYTISGSTLTPTTAWPSGTNNVVVLYLGRTADIGTPSDGTVSTAKIVDANVTKAKLASSVFASQAEQEAGTAVDVAVTPGRQHFHPAAAKAWALITVSGGVATLAASFNVSGITDNGTGDYTITFSTPMSSTNYAVLATAPAVDGGERSFAGPRTKAVGSVRINVLSDGGVISDPSSLSVLIFGDL